MSKKAWGDRPEAGRIYAMVEKLERESAPPPPRPNSITRIFAKIGRGLYDIADEAMASDPSEDGADRFASAREWADWCVAGQDGDAVLALARAQGLDETPLLAALRQILSERDLAGINAAFDAA